MTTRPVRDLLRAFARVPVPEPPVTTYRPTQAADVEQRPKAVSGVMWWSRELTPEEIQHVSETRMQGCRCAVCAEASITISAHE